jgi:hypothetical protein
MFHIGIGIEQSNQVSDDLRPHAKLPFYASGHQLKYCFEFIA